MQNDIATATLHGPFEVDVLYAQAEELRDALLENPAISKVYVTPWQERQVKIEVSQDTLRSYGMTLEEIAGVVRRHAITIPGGLLEGDNGQLLVTTGERIVDHREFGRIPIRHSQHGTPLLLSDDGDHSQWFSL